MNDHIVMAFILGAWVGAMGMGILWFIVEFCFWLLGPPEVDHDRSDEAQ